MLTFYHNYSTNDTIVLGGRATIREIAQSYEKVYGVKANLERLGSLDDLYKFMHEKRAQNPADIYGYMSLYVTRYFG